MAHPMRSLAAAGLAIVLAAAALAGAAAQAPSAELKPGDVAPAFTLPGSDGKGYSLADYRGVKPVVVGWLPKSPIRE
jgi:hypothetical protein